MTTVFLQRFGNTPYGTFGEVKLSGRVFYTIEKPWRNNEKNVSCVPYGRYKLLWLPTTTSVPSEFGGHTWYLEGETVGINPADGKLRNRVAMHIANTDDDVQGCIGWGMDLGYIHRRWGVTSSVNAMLTLLDILGPQSHEISIEPRLMG